MLFDTYKADFTQYKPTTIDRRLRRRMALRRVNVISEYLDPLREDPGEVAALYDDLLIRVTSFFRDPNSFEVLSATVFPAICASRTGGAPLRIWVPGCATGEEVYSIAIVLLEYLGASGANIPLQFFGTDLSEAAIGQAGAARHPDTIADQVSLGPTRAILRARGPLL